MIEERSQMINKPVRLFFRVDMFIEGGERVKGWRYGTGQIKGVVNEINNAGVLLTLDEPTVIGSFLFNNATPTLFFPWHVVSLLDVIEEQEGNPNINEEHA